MLSSLLVLTPPSFFNHPPTTEIYTLSLHDALPILPTNGRSNQLTAGGTTGWHAERSPASSSSASATSSCRSEEHTSELQSLRHLVCRLLLEKKKKNQQKIT